METINARVLKENEKHFLKIESEDSEIRIPMSEDKPNDVKAAFNQIIALIKKGAIQIQFQDLGDDLFTQVANEYVMQLNREILEVHGVMKYHGLVTE